MIHLSAEESGSKKYGFTNSNLLFEKMKKVGAVRLLKKYPPYNKDLILFKNGTLDYNKIKRVAPTIKRNQCIYNEDLGGKNVYDFIIVKPKDLKASVSFDDKVLKKWGIKSISDNKIIFNKSSITKDPISAMDFLNSFIQSNLKPSQVSSIIVSEGKCPMIELK